MHTQVPYEGPMASVDPGRYALPAAQLLRAPALLAAAAKGKGGGGGGGRAGHSVSRAKF